MRNQCVKYDKGDCSVERVDLRLHRQVIQHDVNFDFPTQVEACKYVTAGYDCVDPEVLALWSSELRPIESNSNTDGEQSVGQVSSPSECIAKVLDSARP